MRAFLLTTMLVVLSFMASYAMVITVQNVNQLAGTGTIAVPKTDVRILMVRVPPAIINSVTLIASSSLSGTYTISVVVNVGACTATGSAIATLTSSPTTITINLSSSCLFNNPATVTVLVRPA